MLKDKGNMIVLLCALAIVLITCLANNIGGLTLVVIFFLVMCAGFNYYNGINQQKTQAVRKYKRYQARECEDVYYDTRLKTLRKKVINKELDELKYKYERDQLTKQFNEGKIHDENES